MKPWFALIPVTLLACGREDAPRKQRPAVHAPVDPAFDLGIVVPDDFKKIWIGDLHVDRAKAFPSPEAWAADQAVHNQSYEVGPPSDVGDAWEVTLTKVGGGGVPVRIWHRQLDDDLAIDCARVTAAVPLPETEELVHKACVQTQRVSGGIFVPGIFGLPYQYFSVVLARVDEPLNWSVGLDLAANVPDYRLDPKGPGGDHQMTDHGRVSDGDWFISAGDPYRQGMHYNVVAHRRIGALDLVCHGDNYYDEAYTRRQLALCLGLERP